jgi:hypothetical protein
MLYSEFKPTGFDNHIQIEDRENWHIMPISINRDTECCVTLSNWQVCQDMMNKANIEYELHNFGHWACGWFEILIVHPDSQDFVEEIENLLDQYPILNDDHHSNMEIEKEDQSWSEYGFRDFLSGYNDIASNETEEHIVTLLENMDKEELRSIFDCLDGTVEHSDYGVRYYYPDPDFTDLLNCLLSKE